MRSSCARQPNTVITRRACGFGPGPLSLRQEASDRDKLCHSNAPRPDILNKDDWPNSLSDELAKTRSLLNRFLFVGWAARAGDGLQERLSIRAATERGQQECPETGQDCESG